MCACMRARVSMSVLNSTVAVFRRDNTRHHRLHQMRLGRQASGMKTVWFAVQQRFTV